MHITSRLETSWIVISITIRVDHFSAAGMYLPAVHPAGAKVDLVVSKVE